jgi:hypothetical protein
MIEEVSMLKTWIAPAAAAFAVLLLVGTVDTAEAKRGGGGKHFSGGGGGQGRSYSRSYSAPRVYSSRGVKSYYAGNGGHKYKHGRHIRKYVIVGAPLAYGYYGYADSCYGLRRRAEDSGSSYWWNRYYACIDGYGYYD